MNQFYITGTSSGIGLGLANQLLINESNKVTGFSRSNTIAHANFRFIPFDLTNTELLYRFRFPEPESNPELLVLINNAGVLGEINLMQSLSDLRKVNEVYQVNLVAPTLLSSIYLNQFNAYTCKKLIINISSGAGRHPIDSWATYCASKAGLDMLTNVINKEIKLHNQSNVRAFSIAPGIVDTPMQNLIREVSTEQFSRVNEFISLKTNNQLLETQDVANKLINIIFNTDKFEDTILDLRNLD